MHNIFQNLYDKQCHLWRDDQNNIIQKFASSNPLTVSIRDKFQLYDNQTAELIAANKIITVGCIIINMGPVYDAFVEHSKSWKIILGQSLSDKYKERLDFLVEFIKDRQTELEHTLNDLSDVRLAMNCLEKIRENFIE